MMPTCMPTRLLATTDSHSAHVAPRLQSAPHSLDLPYSHPLHTASAPPDEPTLLSALAAYCKSPYPHRSPTTTRARTVPCTERCRYGTRDFASILIHHLREVPCHDSLRKFYESFSANLNYRPDLTAFG